MAGMSFMEWVTSTAVTGGVLSGIGWLARHLIIERLANAVRLENDKELETHRANLKRDYDVQIENLKAANLRFQHIFADQATAIVTVYQNLLPLLDATEDFTKLFNDADKATLIRQIETLHTASNTFYDFYRPNKIYIPKPTAEKLSLFLATVHQIASKHHRLETLSVLHEKYPDKLEQYGKDLDNLKETVSPMLADLEKDFQTVLGIYNDKKELQ